MLHKKTGLTKIREVMGELALERSDHFVIRTWLKTVIERSVRLPSLSSFAPFQEYFVNQQPVENQLAYLFSSEFSTPVEGADDTNLTTFRIALSDHLSAPSAFTYRLDGRLVLSDLYRDLFGWLADEDALLALDIATNVVRTPSLADLSFASSQPLALYLFQVLDEKRVTKSSGRSFYAAIFRFALKSPTASVAEIPDILDAYIRALGQDNEVLFDLFCESPKLELEYRGYLGSNYPRLLVKYMESFLKQIEAAIPHGFRAYLRGLDDARFSKVRASCLVASLSLERPISKEPKPIRGGKDGPAIAASDPVALSTRKPSDLNEAADLSSRRASVPA